VTSVSADEYLEALWRLLSKRSGSVRVKDISDVMKVAPSSVVQMLTKMEKDGFVKYERRSGVSFTRKGARRARILVRSHRLMEVLLVKVVGIKPDKVEHAVCGAEHYISKSMADQICTFLNHPKTCPHGEKIPRGKCCSVRQE